MLVNMKEMLKDAAKGGYAVGGFNCASLESAVAAVRASEELNMPFISDILYRGRLPNQYKSCSRRP